MFFRMEAQVPIDVAMDQRAAGNHLRVDDRVPRQPPEKITAVPVRPVHHRRRAKPVGDRLHHRRAYLQLPEQLLTRSAQLILLI